MTGTAEVYAFVNLIGSKSILRHPSRCHFCSLPGSSTSGFKPGSDYNVTFMYNGTYVPGTYNNSSSNTGSWYSWTAATAGSGISITSSNPTNAPSDICPKDW